MLGDSPGGAEGANIRGLSSAPEKEAALLSTGREVIGLAIRGIGEYETGPFPELGEAAFAGEDVSLRWEARTLGLGIRPSWLYDMV